MTRGLAALGFTIASASPALAYLDPGTGSMILQAIIGGLAVVAGTASLYWAKIKAFIFRTKK